MKLKFVSHAVVLATLLIAGCSGIESSQQLVQSETKSFSSETPVVVKSSPAGDVAPDKSIFVAFSLPMDASTINVNNLRIEGVAANVSYDAKNRVAYLKPATLLAANSRYRVTVSTGVRSAAGVAMPVAHSFEVGTRERLNTSPPGVILIPGCVPTTGSIFVKFTEDMDSTTINESTFLVAGVTGTVSYDAVTRIAMFTPSAALTAGATLTVTLTTGIKDLGGNSIGSEFSFNIDVCTENPPDREFCTFTKGGYHGNGEPGQHLQQHFISTFPSGMTIGINDGAGSLHHHIWTADATGIATLRNYLTSPSGGASTALPTDLVNPENTISGNLATQVATLTLNVNFSGTGDMPAGFGNLKLKNTGTSLDGATVSAILAIANNALAGNGLPEGYTFSNLNDLIDNLNKSSDNCEESAWATVHLE
jgi:hypothetical protein